MNDLNNDFDNINLWKKGLTVTLWLKAVKILKISVSVNVGRSWYVYKLEEPPPMQSVPSPPLKAAIAL